MKPNCIDAYIYIYTSFESEKSAICILYSHFCRYDIDAFQHIYNNLYTYIKSHAFSGGYLVLSYPHFLYADLRYRNGVFGMRPEEETHTIFMDLEPVNIIYY